MAQRKALAASIACVVLSVSALHAGPVTVQPCGDLPAAVAALGAPADLEAFALSADGELAVGASRASGRPGGSVLTLARRGESPRRVALTGSVQGLAVAADGATAFAVVRATNRKGSVVGVELVSVSPKTGRAVSLATLPATSRGLALSGGGESLLVACRDEIRSFRMPRLASGPLYRVPGDNVGVAPIEGSSRVLVVQSSRLIVVDLEQTQGRDGLPFSDETRLEGTLDGMMGSVGSFGPIARTAGGALWCVRVERPAPTRPAPAERPAVPPAPVAPEAPRAAEAEPAPLAPRPLPPSPPAPPDVAGAHTVPGQPGSVTGLVAGPMRGEVAAVVLLGPDNVLKDAARAVPDEQGRFRVERLPAGVYRIVAAGKGGRVLICDPPFVTIRVSSNSAVEAPALNVLRAP